MHFYSLIADTTVCEMVWFDRTATARSDIQSNHGIFCWHMFCYDIIKWIRLYPVTRVTDVWATLRRRCNDVMYSLFI